MKLSQVLENEYGLSPFRITPQPCGFSALAYHVQTPGKSYFLKVYEKSKKATAQWTALIDNYIPVLRWLNRNTPLSGRIVDPIDTLDGKYKVEDGECIYLLYSYIHGSTIGEAELTAVQARELAHIVGILHRHNARTIPDCYDNMSEDFNLPFCAALSGCIDEELYRKDGDVKAIVSPCVPRLQQNIKKAVKLADRLKQTKPELVFCHTDIHNFNIMQGGNLVLIDWEGLKLAPPEHDLMFIHGKPYYEDFMGIYRSHHEGFQISGECLAFYLTRRNLEDIWAFIERILYDDMNETERKLNLSLLSGIIESL